MRSDYWPFLVGGRRVRGLNKVSWVASPWEGSTHMNPSKVGCIEHTIVTTGHPNI